jgi:hypothetical protein
MLPLPTDVPVKPKLLVFLDDTGTHVSHCLSEIGGCLILPDSPEVLRIRVKGVVELKRINFRTKKECQEAKAFVYSFFEVETFQGIG